MGTQSRNAQLPVKPLEEEASNKKLPWIIPAMCEGCGACANRCPTGCLQMTASEHDGFEVPWIDLPDQCIGCGLCEKACAMGAINMTSYTGKARERLYDRKGIKPFILKQKAR